TAARLTRSARQSFHQRSDDLHGRQSRSLPSDSGYPDQRGQRVAHQYGRSGEAGKSEFHCDGSSQRGISYSKNQNIPAPATNRSNDRQERMGSAFVLRRG